MRGGARVTRDAEHRTPRLHRIRANGVELAWFEWNAHAGGDAPPILLAHATGFHARVWDRTVAHLGSRRVIAVDQRGHGRSQSTPIEHWRVFGRDLAALVQALDLRDVIGVGHSMGGHAMVDAAALCSDRFHRLVLMDPVIAPPSDYGDGDPIAARPDDTPHPTVRRRNHFASAREMFERFVDRPPYSVFDRDALHDYCVHGLRLRADGDGYELACPPDVEASIYRTSRTNGGIHDSIRRIRVPVTILRARLPPPDRDRMDFSSSPTWPALADAFADALDVHLADRTHFIPMEAPALAARWVLWRDGRAHGDYPGPVERSRVDVDLMERDGS